MTIVAALVSAAHVLALGIGLGGIHARGRALRRGDVPGVRHADMWWGVAALLWITTGPARAFLGLEKGTAWYLANPHFYVKMGLFLLVLVLEVWPMTTFIGWRRRLGS